MPYSSTKPPAAVTSPLKPLPARLMVITIQPKPSGGRFSEMPSPTDINPLHDQLREIYGRTVYSHKTHIIQAGMDLTKHGRIKLAQIVLGALTTAGVITAFLGKEYWGLAISALTS